MKITDDDMIRFKWFTKELTTMTATEVINRCNYYKNWIKTEMAGASCEAYYTVMRCLNSITHEFYKTYAKENSSDAEMQAVNAFKDLWQCAYDLTEQAEIRETEQSPDTDVTLYIEGECYYFNIPEIDKIIVNEYPEFIGKEINESLEPKSEEKYFVSMEFAGKWFGNIDDFTKLTHHAEAFYDILSGIHVEVCVEDKWYGGNEHEKFYPVNRMNDSRDKHISCYEDEREDELEL